MPLPPEDLRTVLAPVDLLWARLERPAARRLVEAAVRSELKRVEGFAGRTDAPQVLADRLVRRLDNQLRTGGPITDPVGWLLARGLPQRQWCAEPRCDEGALLDSGQDCPRCEDRIAARRALRDQAYQHVSAAFAATATGGGRPVPPGTPRPDSPQLAAAYAQQLAERSAKVAAAEQQQIDAARARREEEQEAEQARAAAERALAAAPCADCGSPQSAGLCGNCRWIRTQHDQLERVLAQTVRTTLAARPDLTEHTARQHLADSTERALRQRIAYEVRDSVAPELLAVIIAEKAAEEAEFRRMEVATGWVDPVTSPAPQLLASIPVGAWT